MRFVFVQYEEQLCNFDLFLLIVYCSLYRYPIFLHPRVKQSPLETVVELQHPSEISVDRSKNI